jgi:hypothetical protein
VSGVVEEQIMQVAVGIGERGAAQGFADARRVILPSVVS